MVSIKNLAWLRAAALILPLAVLPSGAAVAAGLDGTTVSGYLLLPISAGGQNWWDPASPPPQNPAFVPAPYLNHGGSTTVGISETDPEFGWCACGASNTLISADFTDSALKLISYSDFSLQGGWIETFTDTAFVGLSVTKTLDQHPYNDGIAHPDNGVFASLTGDVLTLTWSGTVTGCGDCRVLGPYEADFTFAPAAGDGGVPEPAAWTLMIAGFGLAGAALRRRRALTA